MFLSFLHKHSAIYSNHWNQEIRCCTDLDKLVNKTDGLESGLPLPECLQERTGGYRWREEQAE